MSDNLLLDERIHCLKMADTLAVDSMSYACAMRDSMNDDEAKQSVIEAIKHLEEATTQLRSAVAVEKRYFQK